MSNYREKQLKRIREALAKLPRHVIELLLVLAKKCAANRPDIYPRFLKKPDMGTFFEENPYVGEPIERNSYRAPEIPNVIEANLEVEQGLVSSLDMDLGEDGLPSIEDFNKKIQAMLDEANIPASQASNPH
ncbi:MAG: hypothetical protein K0R66_1229 [Gammaproteobacteria bacterium]|jgi:hypothetical protein|nr:hypothetical protein [Gammaproteobacteria bacterium]